MQEGKHAGVNPVYTFLYYFNATIYARLPLIYCMDKGQFNGASHRQAYITLEKLCHFFPTLSASPSVVS